jgi:threonine synthase
LAFEVAEQLGWRLPDHVVVPIASGSQLTKIDKGFRELTELGLVEFEREVRISGAQAEGCSPVATAFAEGADHVRPVKPATIAKSLAIGNPADGWYALEVVLLARTEGIFAETAGGVTVATLVKLASAGIVRADESVVIYITGNGLKTVEALAGHVGPSATIPPTLQAVADLLGRDGNLRAAKR